MGRKKLILDLDTGIDDALALAYALATPDADLIGVVASYGNTLMPTAAQNTLNLLHILGADEIPVFAGATHSLTTTTFTTMQVSKDIHGDNGVGNVIFPTAPQSLATQAGVDFIIEAAHRFQQDLIIVPTGPLTNLAAAFQQDPSIIPLIGNITLMGGALTVPGNVTPYTEANINQDPLAAQCVFTQAQQVVMVGLDVTLQTLLTKKETAQWRQLGTEKARLYADLFDYYIDAYDRLGIDHRGAALHDPLAVGVAVDPSLVTLLPINLTVTVDDGRTIGDRQRLNDSHKTGAAAVEVNVETYLKRFMAYMVKILGAASDQ